MRTDGELKKNRANICLEGNQKKLEKQRDASSIISCLSHSMFMIHVLIYRIISFLQTPKEAHTCSALGSNQKMQNAVCVISYDPVFA